MTRTTLAFEAISVGDEITALAIPLTSTRIVAGAIASRDFMPVHHDRDYAQSQGAPDIFPNILSDTGWASRFLTDWAGPEAMVRRIAVRLGIPVHPGMELRYTGSVTATRREGDEGRVEVDFRASVDAGDHLTGSAIVSLPLGGGP
jgi:acyl dehydratase